jgi:hypothetical protein
MFTSAATKCLTAYLDAGMSAARLPSYVTKTSIALYNLCESVMTNR